MADLTRKAKQAIDEMFRDTSVSQPETARNLREIIEHCEILVDSLQDDEDLEID